MKKIILILTAVLALAGAADAKWWIFGKSKDEVGLKYLYINRLSADETGPKFKIFRETLGSDGLVKITGRASTGKSAVGSVRISLDNKGTWSDVKFADNGTFEYAFKPETGRTYAMLLEITDTAGKTNKVEETRKELTLSEESVQAKVKETLDAMFDAYSKENLARFMGYVGENFAGDKAILERAVKRDFDALSNISLRYTLNNVASGAQGRIFVSVTYNRMVFVNKTGASTQDTGSTEFVFDSNEGKLSLYSMKQPLMFGLSDAENVATGVVQGNTSAALVLDDSGNIGDGGTLVTINCAAGTWPKYTFASGAKTCSAGGGGADIWFYDETIPYLMGFSANERTFMDTLAALSGGEVKDPAGYAAVGVVSDSGAGYSYCFQLTPDFYCVEMVSAKPTSTSENVSFKVKKY
ncbi:MAG TPA: hypothetical protein DCZ92_06635 [Elusimicrobia bacterium]|nr:MAG: hypothetical protein A2016_04055 [Elusimicrobia bacterium GWF2_62_30]HBA60482.1 hypothetical protein [Elusimicrobiota bacterium]